MASSLPSTSFRLRVLAGLAGALLPLPLFAAIGVGIGTGKIVVEEPLKPGGSYDLPALPVLNTGDEPGTYEVTIEYHENQPELKPEREWFSFTPASFSLDPSGSQIVEVALTLPLKTEPGDYFAYVEAHPTRKADDGQSRVGVAAAAKLYFKVAPANVFQAAYHRVASFITRNAPWSYVVMAVVAGALLLKFLRRFIHLDIRVQRRPPQP